MWYKVCGIFRYCYTNYSFILIVLIVVFSANLKLKKESDIDLNCLSCNIYSLKKLVFVDVLFGRYQKEENCKNNYLQT